MASVLPALGTRIIHNGSIGTIRFVGQVDNTQGIWLGVEWDDPQRGKHDGVKDGKRYFSCLATNAGSFIRPSTSIYYGTSFLKALVSKYVESYHGSATQEKVLLGSSNGAIEVEAVNLDKIRGKFSRLERLREVSLDNEGVAIVDPPGEIHNACPGIRGLDLSRNLLPSWDMVAMIISEMPALERLALNQSRLSVPRDSALMLSAFCKLKELQISATLMTWDDFNNIAGYMPALQLVEMGYNHLQSLSLSDIANDNSCHNSTLESINFDSNELSVWSHISSSVRRYTGLQRLILTSNRIERIDRISESQELPLHGLKHLALSFNRLAHWSDIDNLYAWCPLLESLSLIQNPIVTDTESANHSRQFVIARFPSLLALDGTTISPKERSDSELFYLSYITKQRFASEAEIYQEHPRWKDLCDKYGKPERPDATMERQDTLSNRLIRVNVYRSAEMPSVSTTIAEAPTSLRILPSMSMRIFRMKVLKSLKVPRGQYTSLQMWLKMGDGQLVEMDPENESIDLEWWGLEDGSDIILYVGGT